MRPPTAQQSDAQQNAKRSRSYTILRQQYLKG